MNMWDLLAYVGMVATGLVAMLILTGIFLWKEFKRADKELDQDYYE